jgi:hypothetical protein
MESLNLSVPEQHGYTDPTVERDAERLRARLTNLPLMDVVETVRQVHNALEAFNEQKIDTDLRLELLTVFRDTVQRLFVTVDPLHVRQLALSKAQRDQATKGVEQLLLGMAGGYKIIIRDYYDSPGKQTPDRAFALAVNHALEQLGYALLDSYRFYRSVQDRIFTEMHQLYRLARHHGLLEVTADAGLEHDQPLSTAAIYHTAMLLALSDPFRLAEGEAGLVHDVLKQHAAGCRVVPGNSWSGKPEGLFFVDLQSDRPPETCMRLESPVSGEEPFLLDARDALAAVRERLSETPAKVRQQSPEAMVLRRLLPEEVDPRKTRAARHPDSRWVQLLLGLEQIHAYQVSMARFRSGAGGPDGDAASKPPSHCRIVDSSEGGMRIAWDDGGAGDARVGELLGVTEEGRRFQLAVIRNIRIYREGGMEIGVQLIAGATAPVYCRGLDGEDDRARCALFMPASEDDTISATLVVATGFYTRGRRMLIDVSGKEIRACAGRNVFDGPVFDRFEFSADADESG